MSDKAPGWITKIFSGKDDRREKIQNAVRNLLGDAEIFWKKMYGCGHYGCAFAIETAMGKPLPWIVKITRDPTEGPMQAAIGKRQANGDYGFEAFAVVKGVFRLEPDIDWKGKKWPVYAIVREEVTPIYSLIGDFSWFEKDPKNVEGIYPLVTKARAHDGIKALHDYKDLSAKWHTYTEKMKKAKKPAQIAAGERLLENVETNMNSALTRISNAFPPLGEVMGILQYEGAPLRDVHGNNIGVRTHHGVVDPQDPEAALGYVVCFDPGHTPSSEEIAAEEKAIARLNPAKSKAQENTVETEDLEVPGLSFAPTVDLHWPANSSYSDKDWFKRVSFTVVISNALGDPDDPDQDPPVFSYDADEEEILRAIERRWNLHNAMWTTGTWSEGRGQNKDCFVRMGIATPSAGDQKRLEDDQEGSVYENPGSMPEGFSADDFFEDSTPVAPRSAADDLLSRVKRDDVVKIKNTKWLVFRAFGVGASQAWVYKHPSKQKKMYTLYRVGYEQFAVYEVNGMSERVSEDIITGPAEIVD